MASRLVELYKNEITKGMMEKFGYKNPMEIPKIEKVVINMGVGEARDNAKVLDYRTKSSSNKSEKISCELQNQRRNANWSKSYSSWRQNVAFC